MPPTVPSPECRWGYPFRVTQPAIVLLIYRAVRVPCGVTCPVLTLCPPPHDLSLISSSISADGDQGFVFRDKETWGQTTSLQTQACRWDERPSGQRSTRREREQVVSRGVPGTCCSSPLLQGAQFKAVPLAPVRVPPSGLGSGIWNAQLWFPTAPWARFHGTV